MTTFLVFVAFLSIVATAGGADNNGASAPYKFWEEQDATTAQNNRALQTAGCYNADPCPPCYETRTCCMLDNYKIYNGGNSLGCTANSLGFTEITGITVFDPGAKKCNCGACTALVDCVVFPDHPSCDCNVDAGLSIDCIALGEDAVDCEGLPYETYFGACRGSDDVVDVSFTVNIDITSTQFDVGLYIATNGGEGE